MLYRILTERRDNLQGIVSKYFDAATIYDAMGLWRGTREESTAIELDDSGRDAREFRSKVDVLAEEIRETNKQEAVLVQEWPVISHLVAKPVQVAA